MQLRLSDAVCDAVTNKSCNSEMCTEPWASAVYRTLSLCCVPADFIISDAKTEGFFFYSTLTHSDLFLRFPTSKKRVTTSIWASVKAKKIIVPKRNTHSNRMDKEYQPKLNW